METEVATRQVRISWDRRGIKASTTVNGEKVTVVAASRDAALTYLRMKVEQLELKGNATTVEVTW
jgi:hypothetical protein